MPSIAHEKMYLYLIVVLVIVAIIVVGWYYFSYTGMMRCGPCGCYNEGCGGVRYYWNCTTRGTICSPTNPGNCLKLNWGNC